MLRNRSQSIENVFKTFRIKQPHKTAILLNPLSQEIAKRKQQNYKTLSVLPSIQNQKKQTKEIQETTVNQESTASHSKLARENVVESDIEKSSKKSFSFQQRTSFLLKKMKTPQEVDQSGKKMTYEDWKASRDTAVNPDVNQATVKNDQVENVECD